MKSRVHPKYKTKYHVRNWASYERALVRRGDVTMWLSPEAIAAWEPDGGGRRGGQRKYSDVAIETALTLRLIFHLPLRQAEGFMTSLFRLMGLDLPSPDHTTLSRRGQHLDVTLRHPPQEKRLHLLIDGTGLSMFGEGEWAAAKHGGHGKRGWRKLHLGVNRSGVIVAQALTEATTDDALTGITLMGAVDGSVASVTADPAYDTIAFYDAATEHGTKVVVPPAKTARLSRRRPRSRARDRTIRRITKMGRHRWKKEAGYHRQAPRGERLLPVQVDSRRPTSRPDSRSARGRVGACVQRAQSDDRAWSTRIVRDRSVTNLRVGSAPCQFRFTQQRRDGGVVMRVRTRSTHAPRRQAKNALRSRALRRRRATIRRVGLYWFVANPFRDYEGFLMAKSCPFCDQRKIAARVFRDHGRWCSLLAAPHITKGHAIVAVKAGGAGCPTEINSDILSGLDTALADVSSALMAFYQPKRVLFASLRGHVEHVHFHAVPLWKDEEAQWRNEVGYQSGHLLEFLGHLEKREFARREAIMKERGLGNEQYRAEIQSALLPDVQRLREYTRYTPA